MQRFNPNIILSIWEQLKKKKKKQRDKAETRPKEENIRYKT